MAVEKVRKLLRVEPIVDKQIKELTILLSYHRGEKVTEGSAVQIAVSKLLDELTKGK